MELTNLQQTNLQLENLILQYNNAKTAYYTGTPIMTDEEFDALEEQLVEFGYDPKVGYVDNANDKNKVEHGQKMLSLGKRKVLSNEMDLSMAEEIFNQYGAGNLSWKYDGIAINISYKGGKLQNASTRGNGTFGRNVMYKLKNKLPQTITETKDVELRFEAVMKNQTFIDNYSETYAHPRNLVAGIFADITETDERINDVDLIFLEAINVTTGELLDLNLFNEFTQKDYFAITNAKELKQAFDKANSNRNEYDYGTDGLVYTSSEHKYFAHNGHHPKHAIAIKFMPPRLISTIEKITWNLQRTGKYCPIIHFKSFVIDGRKIAKASGYNLNYLIENDLCAGKQVQIILANDIIPQVRAIN